MAHIVMAYTVMACIVMAQASLMEFFMPLMYHQFYPFEFELLQVTSPCPYN